MVFTFVQELTRKTISGRGFMNHNIPLLSGEDLARVPNQLGDVHRRIRNILDVCPATSWTLDESVIILDALATIVRTRQAAADVIDLTARRSLR
jgi:hypothetical protein